MSLKQQERADPLKQIAGLIAKLSYRDMQTFGQVMADALSKKDDCDAPAITDSLLTTADELLKRPGRDTDGPTYRGDRLTHGGIR